MEEIRNTEQIYPETNYHETETNYHETDYRETVSDDVKRSESMKEIRKAAQMYYDTGSDDDKRLVVEWFYKMDSDEDEKVSFAEFKTFMTREGYGAMNNRSFFKKINKNKNGELDFEDVMTLYYIIDCGRPVCDGCRKFIGGMYYTCFECFTKKKSFSLHSRCFREKKYKHKETHSRFDDNYALLEYIKWNGLPAQNNEQRDQRPGQQEDDWLEDDWRENARQRDQRPGQQEDDWLEDDWRENARQRDQRPGQQEDDWRENARCAAGIAANIAAIGAAIAQCTIL